MKLKIVIIFLLFFSSLIVTEAQEKPASSKDLSKSCKLKIEDSPLIYGLRLGMAITEVKKEYPKMVFMEDFPKGSLEDRDNAGIARTPQITNSIYKENLEEVSVMLGKDNKIITIFFSFITLESNLTLKDLTNKFSKDLNFPYDWQPSRGGGNLLSLYCDGFAITAGFNEQKKTLLFLAVAPENLTKEDKEVLKPNN